ncbi:MAG: hypothetical protein OZ929_21765 [Bryobacterales bacterium]|nr:hypothetical protein [Bryobacterales bacterium]
MPIGNRAMTSIERLREMANALSLTALDVRLESLLEQASKNEPSYADLLPETLTTGQRGGHSGH